ncbi:hypothetical protein HanIR_Chr03g0149641 [Helianthus annuus]|nr:hypothetical protein HanIR_Chr03g0149641 [Helianthus annuus]
MEILYLLDLKINPLRLILYGPKPHALWPISNHLEHQITLGNVKTIALTIYLENKPSHWFLVARKEN